MRASPLGCDGPTAGDRRRGRAARTLARARLDDANAAHRAAIMEIFRDEIGATVRSVSPFLKTLVGTAGLDLDDLVERMVPAAGWPARPRRWSGRTLKGWPHRRMLRHYAERRLAGTGIQPSWAEKHGLDLVLDDRSWARIVADGHSLEVSAMIGDTWLETCHGRLRVELDPALKLPATLTVAAVGRPVAALFDHAALRGRGWPIVEVGDDPWFPFVGVTLVVATGASPYRVPWARPEVTT